MAKLLLYQIISYNVEIKWEYELKKLHIFSVFFTQKFAYIKYQKLFFVQQFHRKMKVFSWKIYLEVAKFKIGNRYAMSIFFFWIMHFFCERNSKNKPTMSGSYWHFLLFTEKILYYHKYAKWNYKILLETKLNQL